MSVRNKSSGEFPQTHWNSVADWYDKHVGQSGNEHQRTLAIPAVLDLLELKAGQQILDIGAGQGVLAPYIAAARAGYTGVEASERLVRSALRRHSQEGRFLHGDARRLEKIASLTAKSFDAAVFLLSLQDMDPLQDVLTSAAWALRPGGCLIVLMNHPCFRVPRQSGWGWDSARKLQFRRVDRYLTPLAVPMAPHIKGQKGTATKSFHRPLEAYVQALRDCGLYIDTIKEIAGLHSSTNSSRQVDKPNSEIPLFLALRAIKR
ncbi:MAG TPA: class I SAM-dependent methyltransferase [Capsulimonadaceae bacterium]|nr:class I SAM-dependent methyltransferase [Capsulimonadaceae bacterium]